MTESSRPSKAYCSTSAAAKRLGLSMGTVQQMTETGALEAWKTIGGHRRILVSSVDAFLARANGGGGPPKHSGGLNVLIAEDDDVMCELYQRHFDAWQLPVRIHVVTNGVEALMEIGRQMPDLLIVDLGLPGIDGFEMIRRLRASALSADLDIIVVSGMQESQIGARGGLPPDITLYGKPTPFSELRGYVQAKIAQQWRHQRCPG